jgi:hypothetical protein
MQPAAHGSASLKLIDMFQYFQKCFLYTILCVGVVANDMIGDIENLGSILPGKPLETLSIRVSKSTNEVLFDRVRIDLNPFRGGRHQMDVRDLSSKRTDMNIQIDESVEIRIVDLMDFADGYGCELVSQNGEILIRARCESDISLKSTTLLVSGPLV